MIRDVRRTAEESRYFVLLNSLAEAGHQMDNLAVPAEARELLLKLSDYCRADFDRRFR